MLKEKPDWPPVKALIRIHLPLRRLQSHYSLSKKWAPHHFALRDGCLYYSNGKLGHADSQEGTMAYMSGNPPPDGRHCIDLSSALTVFPCLCCQQRVSLLLLILVLYPHVLCSRFNRLHRCVA